MSASILRMPTNREQQPSMNLPDLPFPDLPERIGKQICSAQELADFLGMSESWVQKRTRDKDDPLPRVAIRKPIKIFLSVGRAERLEEAAQQPRR